MLEEIAEGGVDMFAIKLLREQKLLLIERVKAYFYEQRSEEIGDLQAELLLEFMLRELGPTIYDKALDDAIRAVGERMLSLEDDLHAMKHGHAGRHSS